LGRGLHLLQDLGRFVYVTFVVDVFAQLIVGLACRHHQGHRPGPDTTADRVVGPGPAKGSRSSRVSCCTTPIVSQYTSIRFTERLAEAGAMPSIGSVGDAYDCESVGCRQAA
jgi:transposase InsO family protein